MEASVAMEIGGGGGAASGGKTRAPKDLYLCQTWEELESRLNAAGNSFPAGGTGTPSVQDTLSTLNEMCLAAVIADMEKDEEQAYLNYSRYLTSYIMLSQMESFQHHPDMMKVEENVGHMVKLVETLKKSLMRRYQAKNGEINMRKTLQQHGANLEAEIDIGRTLKVVREELESLKMVKQLLVEDGQGQVDQGAAGDQAQGQVVDNDGVPEQMKCPVCFDVYQEQVFQCRNGHSMCDNCFGDMKAKECPECRVGLEGVVVRNRALEGLVSEWKVDCPFRNKGCGEKVLCKEMIKHVEKCVWGKNEEQRQLLGVEGNIREKEGQVNKLQGQLKMAKEERLKTEAEWRKLEGCSSEQKEMAEMLENIVKGLRIREKEQEMLLETRLNEFQLSLD